MFDENNKRNKKRIFRDMEKEKEEINKKERQKKINMKNIIRRISDKLIGRDTQKEVERNK